MSRWFRFYSEAMRNPKVLRLSDKDFRLWVNVLAVAAENDGHIPADDDLKLVLGMRLDHLKGGLNRLISGGLIDALEHGYEPHNWSKFQYRSDTSTDRVQKHRAKRNVSETPPDTETDTDNNIVELPSAQKRPASPIAKPDDVTDQTWDDWLSMRKVKKAAVTQTAVERIRAQAVQAGWTLENALAECAANGWQGFKAEWVKANQAFGNRGSPQAQTYTSADRERLEAKYGKINHAN